MLYHHLLSHHGHRHFHPSYAIYTLVKDILHFLCKTLSTMKGYLFESAVSKVILIGFVLQVATVYGFLSTTTTTASSLSQQLLYRHVDDTRHNFADSCCASFSASKTSIITSNMEIPPNLKILILPGFGNDATDYLKRGSLVDSLQEQGWSQENIDVLRVARTDWLQVFWKGMLDIKFWTANADPTRAAFRWYLEQIAKQMEELCDNHDKEEEETCRVIFVGHSAGGWLGRAALGFGSQKPTEENGAKGFNEQTTLPTPPLGPPINLDNVLGLVSLGAPHLPPPPGVMDMTRGALRITNEQFPGAFHKNKDGIFYLTAIGLSVQGEEQQRKSPLEPTTIKGFAYNSYDAVCGDGNTIGDGVVPYCAAHLEDAVQVDLEGVLHSINAPENWYGSSQVIDRWHSPMLQELRTSKKLLTNKNQVNGKIMLDAFSNILEIFKIS
jgi:pimeloyl-ACP methyl ester carboxylesterase